MGSTLGTFGSGASLGFGVGNSNGTFGLFATEGSRGIKKVTTKTQRAQRKNSKKSKTSRVPHFAPPRFLSRY